MKIKFVKYDGGYWSIRGDENLPTINSHFNFYDNSYYYTVDGKQFNHLNDAKRYIRENY